MYASFLSYCSQTYRQIHGFITALIHSIRYTVCLYQITIFYPPPVKRYLHSNLCSNHPLLKWNAPHTATALTMKSAMIHIHERRASLLNNYYFLHKLIRMWSGAHPHWYVLDCIPFRVVFLLDWPPVGNTSNMKRYNNI